MNSYMKKIFEMIRKTGDRVILVDFNSEEAFVLMPFADYEGLLQDLKIPKQSLISKQVFEPRQDEKGRNDIWESMREAGSSSETWDLSQMSPAELEELERQYQMFSQAKSKDEEDTKKTKEPSISNEKDVGDGGEEQFYLEPIE
ncbi:MAG: hypothetical protein UX57_C0005G0010 [Candidatus Uhrbacteria bacterium GW2011_GWE2_46_68]|uniref:Uncharacterized protein n=2 Tax=Candidatus Uhriibacteriota TaxID=1752732 RepID=A0A0G1T726_9BACT|nr:MAG: hypothetical protein UX45_C0003G0009 [Candidatus Uhrbacteria bacterium GW2011_GWF2_46_218]KKU41180.1 MAG: hypothetical protein UX57_C0005G0010 [Candidatus Uhrbacteria bacterium GW2011_GWE2_46_68]